jgi:selT/selW/selH-like putative selenoprotein
LKTEGFDVTATPGTSGQFDVIRDGTLVFSKREAKRFPERGEVLSLLQG